MESLTDIYKFNGQNPKLSTVPGYFDFNPNAGFLVYAPATDPPVKEKFAFNKYHKTINILKRQ